MTARASEPRRPFVSLKLRDKDLHRRLKMRAARVGVSLQLLVERALSRYLEEVGG